MKEKLYLLFYSSGVHNSHNGPMAWTTNMNQLCFVKANNLITWAITNISQTVYWYKVGIRGQSQKLNPGILMWIMDVLNTKVNKIHFSEFF